MKAPANHAVSPMTKMMKHGNPSSYVSSTHVMVAVVVVVVVVVVLVVVVVVVVAY